MPTIPMTMPVGARKRHRTAATTRQRETERPWGAAIRAVDFILRLEYRQSLAMSEEDEEFIESVYDKLEEGGKAVSDDD
jgi:hypothetical protein